MSRNRIGGLVPLLAGVLIAACQPETGPEAVRSVASALTARPPTDTVRLGRELFFDTSLSGQACATCHGPAAGYTGPSSQVNATTVVYSGAIHARFGNRKPPTAAYAASADLFALDVASSTFSGGNFWDGRATGEKLGNPAADQAQGPFLNPLEQNNPDAATVVRKVCTGSYAPRFREVWGGDACADVARAYDFIALSIAAFEASDEVSAFSSKFDAWVSGRAALSARERRGLTLFKVKARCALCHPPPLFTDFTFVNIGVPRNPSNPFYGELDVNPAGSNWVDPGLGGFLATQPNWAAFASANIGKLKVPTLRNVDARPTSSFVKAYTHNGFFKSLKSIVHFYNTRDVLPVCGASAAGVIGETCWPPPETRQNINHVETGNLGLTSAEEDDLVAFLETLSDGYHRDRGAESPKETR